MSASAKIDLTWADGDYAFRLGLKELRELQEKCKAGPFTIYSRLVNGEWFVDDPREVIRLGLIGGGLKPDEATRLIKLYVDERPRDEGIRPAQLILMAALVGVPDDPVGKEGEAETAPEAG